MTTQIEAIVRNGALQPVHGLPDFISEGQRVNVVIEDATSEPETQPKPRIAGLHEGMGWMSDDFDDELPDSFWLGEE